MITADLPYTQPPAIIRRRCGDSSQAQGDDGKFLEGRIAAIRHMLAQRQQWESILEVTPNGEQVDLEDSLDVSSLEVIPPKRTYTMRVRYKYAGRGLPLPYDFADESDEE